MSDKFDRYREALVVETETVWPPRFDDMDAPERNRLEEGLHADPASCAQIEYVRVHTGFCRRITVTADDVDRLQASSSPPDEAKE